LSGSVFEERLLHGPNRTRLGLALLCDILDQDAPIVEIQRFPKLWISVEGVRSHMQKTDEVLTQWTQEDLEAAIDGNRLAYSAVLGESPLGELHVDADAFWFITGVPHAILNGVAQAQLVEGGIEERIDALLDPFQARRLPMHWVVSPLSEPANLGVHLQARGLSYANDQPVMAMDLADLDDDQPLPAGLELAMPWIQTVVDADMLEAWLRPFGLGYQLPNPAARALAEIFAWNLDRSETYSHYLGLLDGQPVACSSLLLAAGVAGVYNVAVVPEVRQRGIGLAMTLAPLRQARAQGYRAAILFTSQMGYNLYRRLGFATQFHQSLYVWSPEGAR
jgi:ribosomal protein S18 acetylase RimI-like enzyme